VDFSAKVLEGLMAPDPTIVPGRRYLLKAEDF